MMFARVLLEFHLASLPTTLLPKLGFCFNI
jgi:hypothetical protein